MRLNVTIVLNVPAGTVGEKEKSGSKLSLFIWNVTLFIEYSKDLKPHQNLLEPIEHFFPKCRVQKSIKISVILLSINSKLTENYKNKKPNFQ